MLEPYEWKRSRTVLRRESGSNPADLADYRPLIEGLGGEVVNISATSRNHINAMDREQGYGGGKGVPIGTQRSGSDGERSRSEISELSPQGGSEGYGACGDDVVLKSEFLLSLCEQLMGDRMLSAKEKSIIDRCTASVYRSYIKGGYQGKAPTLQDFHAGLLSQPEPETRDVALAIELFTEGSLNTFAKPTNVDTNSRILCYDIRDLGKQLLRVLLGAVYC